MSKTRAIGYVRVSTEEQAAEGVSLAAQRAKLEAYATVADLELVAIIEDAGLSAKTLDGRPGVARALSMLADGEAAALVVVKLDRLSRSTRDVLDLADLSGREGWALHSLSEKLDTSSAAGRFVLTILAALAQMEREQIGERTKAALRHIRSTGRKTGGSIPYGFDVDADGRLIPNDGEQEALALIRSMRSEGATLKAIKTALETRGIMSKAGRAWQEKSIDRLVKASM